MRLRTEFCGADALHTSRTIAGPDPQTLTRANDVRRRQGVIVVAGCGTHLCGVATATACRCRVAATRCRLRYRAVGLLSGLLTRGPFFDANTIPDPDGLSTCLELLEPYESRLARRGDWFSLELDLPAFSIAPMM